MEQYKYFSSPSKGSTKTKMLVWIVICVIVIVVVIAVYFLLSHGKSSQTKTPIPTTTTAPVQTDGWDTYTDSVANITFQYPAKLNSSYISLQQKPSVIITPQGNSIINADGCYLSSNPTAKNYSQITYGNMHFCVSSTNEGAAGTFYNTYYYTTLKNGDYYTLEFVISEVDCGVYGGAGDPKYQACTNDDNNYNSIVTQQIQKSVSTLQSYKSPLNPECTTNSDCQNGASCMVEGPIIANQPIHKVCVPKGQAVPL
jgi:hypothetical protein